MSKLQELLALSNQRAERLMALSTIMEGTPTVAARALTETEQAEITEIRNGAAALDEQIRNAKFIEDQKAANAAKQFQDRVHAGLDPGTGKQKDVEQIQKRYSITRAAQMAAGYKVDAGLEKEMHEEGIKEARSANMPITGNGVLIPSIIQERATAGTAADAGNLIPTNQMATIEGYKQQLYVETLGATMHMGLTGINNIPVADMTAVSAFIGEGDAFTAITSSVRRPSAVAKGLMSKLTNSWFLKAQAGPESDRILSATLDRASQNALNTNIIKRANANSSHGLFGASDIVDVSGTDGSAFSRDLLIEMINAAAKNNAGGDRAGWLVSPTIRETAQKLKTDTGSGLFVWSDATPSQLLGYTAAVTTLMPTTLTKGTMSGTGKGAAFGYWDNLHVFNWALKELIVDNASSDSGVVLKQVEFWDWVFANPKAFSIAYFT